jgi:hypothetical protein
MTLGDNRLTATLKYSIGCYGAGILMLLEFIELSKNHDNIQSLLSRHSGEGRNPVNPTSPALWDKTKLHFE